MPNVTIALDEATLKASREYAAAHGTTLNEMIRRMLRQATQSDSPADWAQQFITLAATAGGHSHGQRWTRDELHERR
ncbi:MAG: ribbon-helix-helix protein, CopG family [Armatimonadetes bacterium]|nr:ribbon-helix-helix protein, CopG family [Armatimonadota bacterium]